MPRPMRVAGSSLLLFVLASTAGAAHATVPPLPGTRALGMAGALRGAATGDAALSVNPSGMSLMRSYVIEGSYTYASAIDGHDLHASIVDSTSGFNLGGGVYYTHHASSPAGEGGPERGGHEGGLALSFPLGDRLAVGATGRYLRLTTEGGDLPEAQVARGFTFDVGLTLRPAGGVTIGVVGHNLRRMRDPRAPFALGGGVAVSILPDLLATFDGVLDFTSYDPDRGNVWHFMGGAEYLLANRFGFRAGGGRRGHTGRGFVAGGLSAVAEVGALDVGLQQDLSGDRKETIVGISARLFVPFAPTD